jgi:hypothetical protein
VGGLVAFCSEVPLLKTRRVGSLGVNYQQSRQGALVMTIRIFTCD